MSTSMQPPAPFEIQKVGHVVLNVRNLETSARFYQDVLGFQVSDRYPDTMVPGGMVFLRCGQDHHTIALVGGADPARKGALNHFAFEVATPDEVFRARAWLTTHGVTMLFEGRRRAGCQLAVEFEDPDGNHVEIYWGVDKVGTSGHVRPASEWRQAHSLEEAIANPVKDQRVPFLSGDPSARR
jgi:catechol 2,3-dioxygenase-like lactoylglutathione lyase family enzyme